MNLNDIGLLCIKRQRKDSFWVDIFEKKYILFKLIKYLL